MSARASVEAERAAAIEGYLHDHIPLSSAMQIRVLEVDGGRAVIEAPLGPNLNHQSTAFGGSVSALAILTGWTSVHFRLRDEGFETHTVIQQSAVRYDAPIEGPFRATSMPVDDDHWRRFVRTIERKGRGRVRVRVAVEVGGVQAATFHGSYVAMRRDDA